MPRSSRPSTRPKAGAPERRHRHRGRLDWRNGKPFRNASRARIEKEVKDSPRRLRTDVIDIYQVHWPDPQRRSPRPPKRLRHIFEAGKIRAIGVSNFNPAQMEAFRAVAPLHTSQPPYNLFERERRAGCPALLPPSTTSPRSPMARSAAACSPAGSRPKPNFRGDDLRRTIPNSSPALPAISRRSRRLDAFARKNYGKRVLSLAVRWVLDHQKLSVALWGARHPGQLDPVAEIIGWKLDAPALAEIDRIPGRDRP